MPGFLKTVTIKNQTALLIVLNSFFLQFINTASWLEHYSRICSCNTWRRCRPVFRLQAHCCSEQGFICHSFWSTFLVSLLDSLLNDLSCCSSFNSFFSGIGSETAFVGVQRLFRWFYQGMLLLWRSFNTDFISWCYFCSWVFVPWPAVGFHCSGSLLSFCYDSEYLAALPCSSAKTVVPQKVSDGHRYQTDCILRKKTFSVLQLICYDPYVIIIFVSGCLLHLALLTSQIIVKFLAYNKPFYSFSALQP